MRVSHERTAPVTLESAVDRLKASTEYLVTFAVMLSVALIISGLASSVRLQARIASHRERRTAVLYAMSRDLSATRGEEPIVRAAIKHL
jgi:two-component system sensor histidine kinase KdpD